jgi:hypothetical protein
MKRTLVSAVLAASLLASFYGSTEPATNII